MSMNLHFSFSLNGGSEHSFRCDFYQTRTTETEYVLGGSLEDVTSQDPEWQQALARLREITQKRIAKGYSDYKEDLSFIDDLEKSAKAPGIVVTIYSL